MTVVVCCLLSSVCRWLSVDDWMFLFVVCSSSFDSCGVLIVVRCLLSAVRSSLFIVSCRSLLFVKASMVCIVVCCLLVAVRCLLFVASRVVVVCWLLLVRCSLFVVLSLLLVD